MKVPGYKGVCRICFEPIKEGQEIHFKHSDNYYHDQCAKNKPDSYYYALDRIFVESQDCVNPTELMNEMERIFKIPALNDPIFNEENPKVISLYRMISDLRD